MASRNLPLPNEYIANAPTRLTRESFDRAFRRYLPAAAPHLTQPQMDGLFEIACDFRRKDFGIMAIRKGSVVSDLEHCDQVILMSERTLNVLIRRLENFAALGLP